MPLVSGQFPDQPGSCQLLGNLRGRKMPAAMGGIGLTCVGSVELGLGNVIWTRKEERKEELYALQIKQKPASQPEANSIVCIYQRLYTYNASQVPWRRLTTIWSKWTSTRGGQMGKHLTQTAHPQPSPLAPGHCEAAKGSKSSNKERLGL